MNNNNNKGNLSWTVVILVLFLFWPLGLYLLFRKLNSDKSATFNSGKRLKTTGIVLIVLAIMFFFAMISEPDPTLSGGITLAIMFGTPGLWLVRKGKITTELANKYKKYINYIINSEIRDIEDLANRLGKSTHIVEEDINEMINRGLLGQAKLDLHQGLIVFPQRKQVQTSYQQPIQTRTTASVAVKKQEPEFKVRTMSCPGCGANNHVNHLPYECDYCGTIIDK